MTNVQKLAPTGQDFYWYIIEIYDYIYNLRNGRDIISGLNLLDLEYSNSKSENSYVGAKNKASTYMKEEVLGSLKKKYSSKDAEKLFALTYMLICAKHMETIKQLRCKYAAHYHANCIKSGSYSYAERWNDVMEAASNQTIYIQPFENILPWNK